MIKKKGSLMDLIILMVVAFVGVLFFAGWIYAHNLLTDKLLTIDSNSNINITDAAKGTFGQINTALPMLKWVAFAMIFGMIVAIMVSSFLVKAHPVFLIVYVLFLIVSVIFSVYISNAYENILLNDTLGPTVQSFTAVNFIMNNLPIWITIIGIIGGILLFVGITIDREAGGDII